MLDVYLKNLVIIGLVAVLVIMPKKGEARLLQAEDYLKFEWVTGLFSFDPKISPDGKTIIYMRKYVNIQEDQIKSNLWAIDVDGKNDRRLMEALGTGTWSPDSRRIAYVAMTENSSGEIFIRDMRNDNIVQITHQGGNPSHLSWSPDGKWIAFRSNIADKSSVWDIELPNYLEHANLIKSPEIIERLHWQQSGIGVRPKNYSHIFIVSAEGGEGRQLTDGNWQVGSWWAGIQDISDQLEWSPDSKFLIFSADRKPDSDFVVARSSLYTVDVQTGNLQRLNISSEFAIRPKISPDGKLIAYIGIDETTKSNFPTPQLRVTNRDGSSDRALIADTGDFIFIKMQWAKNNSGIYYNHIERGNFNIHYVSLDGESREVTSGSQSLLLSSVSDNGIAVGSKATAEEPGDIVSYNLASGGDMRRLTAVNEDVLEEVKLGKVEEIWYDSTDGMSIQGWITYPPDFNSSEKYPLILSIHGGPEGMFTGDFSFAFQEWAAQGYVVLSTNPRGSIGYGSEFTRAIYNAFPGQGDFEDLMHGVDEVIGLGFIDEERLYVTGVSGGGALTSWIVTQTDRFAAAAALCPITNQISFVGTSDFPAFARGKFKQPFWEDPQTWLEHSPIMHVGKVKTPTLIMVGDKDLRTPVGQSQEFYTALKMRKVPTKLILLRDEGHASWLVLAGHPSNYLRSQSYLHKWFSQWRRVETKQGPSWMSTSE